MNIIYVSGDLTNSKADIICHQVNCKFVMGSGVAKSIRDKWPEVFDQYRGLGELSGEYGIKESWRFLGMCQLVPVDVGQRVANLFGQDNFGNDGKLYTNYAALECSLYALKRHILFNGDDKILSIAFPFNLGCGRGGGDWNKVFDIINKTFSDIDNLTIEIWKM